MFRPPPLPRTLEAALRDITDAKPNVRRGAARDLAPHADEARERVVRALEAALRDDKDARVRSSAAVGLADVAAHEALASLLVAVEDEDAHVRQMAICALGEIGDPRATERLRRALSDRRPEVRFQAAMAFPRVCASRSDAIDALLKASHDDDAFVCHIALRMAEELGDGPDARDARGAHGAHDARGARDVAEERQDRHEHAEPGNHEEVARVVDERLLERARELRGHAAPEVRIAAAILLARAGEVDGVHATLAGVARGDIKTHDSEDEAVAIELCGELGVEDARPGLERRAFGGFLGFGRDAFAWHARVALAAMGHDRAQREILRDLGSWDRDRRTLAVAAAGRARLAGARALIESMRGDDARADPAAVDEALALLASPPGTPRKASAARAHPALGAASEGGSPEAAR